MSTCFWEDVSDNATTSCTYPTGGAGNSYTLDDLLTNEPVDPTYSLADGGSPTEEGGSATTPVNKVDEITGFTDDDGNCVNLRLDGVFPTPDGWDDPNTAPEDPDWEPGVRWRDNAGIGEDCGNIYEPTFGALQARILSIYGEASGYLCYRNNAGFGAFITDAIVTGVSPNYSWSLTVNSYQTAALTGALEVQYLGGSSGVCDQGVDDGCPVDAPLVNDGYWPDDGCYDLALINGQWVANPLDPNVPVGYSSSNQLDVISGGGNATFTANPDGSYTIDDGASSQTFRPDGTRSS